MIGSRVLEWFAIGLDVNNVSLVNWQYFKRHSRRLKTWTSYVAEKRRCADVWWAQTPVIRRPVNVENREIFCVYVKINRLKSVSKAGRHLFSVPRFPIPCPLATWMHHVCTGVNYPIRDKVYCHRPIRGWSPVMSCDEFWALAVHWKESDIRWYWICFGHSQFLAVIEYYYHVGAISISERRKRIA